MTALRCGLSAYFGTLIFLSRPYQSSIFSFNMSKGQKNLCLKMHICLELYELHMFPCCFVVPTLLRMLLGLYGSLFSLQQKRQPQCGIGPPMPDSFCPSRNIQQMMDLRFPQFSNATTWYLRGMASLSNSCPPPPNSIPKIKQFPPE